MIVKRNFDPLKVWNYIRNPMMMIIIWSILSWAMYALIPFEALAINFAPIGILGSALAIFVAFRNNSSYGRWWEARTLWGSIVNSIRVFGRLIITFTDSHSHQENFDPNKSERFKKEMIYLGIAWVHALRLHLRNQDHFKELEKFLSDEDFRKIEKAQNKPNFLLLLIGRKIYEAMANGTLGGFDSFQLEGQLLALANYQGGCERIKNTPLPRQYDYFTRMFVLMFSFLLPLGLLGFFPQTPQLSWICIPITIVLAGIFVILEKTGAANENPFENLITDVPMTALCNTIERDLKEMLGETELPITLMPEHGYLF